MNIFVLSISGLVFFGFILYLAGVEFNLIPFDSGADGGAGIALAMASPLVLVPAGLIFIVQVLMYFTGESYSFGIYPSAFLGSIAIVISIALFGEFVFGLFSQIKPEVVGEFLGGIFLLLVLPISLLTGFLLFIKKFFVQ